MQINGSWLVYHHYNRKLPECFVGFFCCCLFVWYWRLNPGAPYHWTTFPLFYFETGSHDCAGWLQTCDPPPSAFLVTGISGVCHWAQLLSWRNYFKEVLRNKICKNSDLQNFALVMFTIRKEDFWQLFNLLTILWGRNNYPQSYWWEN